MRLGVSVLIGVNKYTIFPDTYVPPYVYPPAPLGLRVSKHIVYSEAMASLGSYKLKHYRAASGDGAGATLKTIALQMGVSEMMVSYLENGQRSPSLKLALKLQALGIAEAGDWHREAPADAAAA